MSQLQIHHTTYDVQDFLNWQQLKVLQLSPQFQRRSVWSAMQRSFLIDSIVRGFPIPMIFLRSQIDDNLREIKEVVDGQQRLRTILSYIAPESLTKANDEADDFVIKKAHNKELANKRFKQLPNDVRKTILSYRFPTAIFPSSVEDSLIYKVFARMNSTGVRLSPQELRNAAYFGQFKSCAYELAYQYLEFWRECDVFTEKSIARMKEVEFISDVLNCLIHGLSGKSKGALDKLYTNYDNEFKYQERYEKQIQFALDRIDSDLGADTIRGTVFSREPMMLMLILLICDRAFGLGRTAPLAKAKRISIKAWPAAIEKIAAQHDDGKLPEDVSKALEAATVHLNRRKILFQFVSKRLK